MEIPAYDTLPRAMRAWLSVAALVLVCGATACQSYSQAQNPAPSWTGDDAYQAILNWNNYFYSGPMSTTNNTNLYSGELNYNDASGNGQNYGVIYDVKGGPSQPSHVNGHEYWGTFWQEAEMMNVAEDAYWWAKTNHGNPGVYLTEIDNLAQGFIDQQWPISNFNGKNPPWSGGDAHKWYGNGYKDIDYEYPLNQNNGSGGDWFNDDLMWAAITFVRAYDITKDANPNAPVSGWLTAAENQVDYVWANARAQFSADGSQVGLLQSFCNKNKPADGTCVEGSGTTSWGPNLDAEVNLTFVIAAKMVANDLGESSTGTHNAEAQKVWQWAKNNLLDATSSYAKTCTTAMGNLASTNKTFAQLSSSQTCAEVYDANNSGIIKETGSNYNVGFNGMSGSWSWCQGGNCGYWSWIAPTSISTWDFSMNYGTAIQAAILMGEPATAQQVANYLMYGLSNPNHGYAGNYEYGNTGIPYNILPNYGSEGANFDGSNGIALRGVAFGLSSNLGPGSQKVLDQLTLNWSQANAQAAWNNKNSNNVMWNDWKQGDSTGGSTNPGYVYKSWDCSDAVAGMLTVAAPD